MTTLPAAAGVRRRAGSGFAASAATRGAAALAWALCCLGTVAAVRDRPLAAATPVAAVAARAAVPLRIEASYPVAAWHVACDGGEIAARGADRTRWSGEIPAGAARTVSITADAADPLADGLVALHVEVGDGAQRVERDVVAHGSVSTTVVLPGVDHGR